MQLPLQVTFRNMEASEAVEQAVQEKAAKLERFYDRIMGCRVMVEAVTRRHHQGNLYRVRIDLTVPGRELVVSREPGLDHAHEDVYVAIRDAFDAIRRQLEDHARRRRHQVKRHEPPPHGRVSQLFPDHGFIETPDGREIYFHRNSVLNGGFDHLQVGTEVAFTEEEGIKGPQASTVRPLGKHHYVG